MQSSYIFLGDERADSWMSVQAVEPEVWNSYNTRRGCSRCFYISTIYMKEHPKDCINIGYYQRQLPQE
jgi:hypothetical protein